MAIPVTLPTKVGKPSKYRNRKVVYDGHTFDSQKEMRRYQVLKDMELKGEIHGMRVHPKFEFKIDGRPVLIRSEGYPNGRAVTWAGDFQYLRPGFGIVVEDVKSPATKTYAWKVKVALYENLYWPAKVETV